jgi:hypothetical protein
MTHLHLAEVLVHCMYTTVEVALPGSFDIVAPPDAELIVSV